jgi:hypothetical protein
MADPFLYNGPATLAHPVRASNVFGRTVAAEFDASVSRSDIAAVDGDGLRCLRRGDTDVRIRSGDLTASFVLECRPVARFASLQSLQLMLGGEPQLLPVSAFDIDGRVITELRFSATVSDTNVVALRSGYAVPRALGTAKITVDVGGRTTDLAVQVTELVAVDTVRMVAGEYRNWALPPGRYRAELGESGAGRTHAEANWRSVNANCAFGTFTRATLYCVLDEPGQVVLLADGAVSATVRIHRERR